MLVLPTGCKLTLISPSHQIHNLVNILANRDFNTMNKILKQKEWPLWLMIYTLYYKKQLEVLIETASTQAEYRPNQLLEITFNFNKVRHNTYYFQWHSNTIIYQPRRFIRHINNATHLAE